MSDTHDNRKSTKKIKYSTRSKVRLTEKEMDLLRGYTEEDPAAYATIAANTKISRDTVLRILKRGWMELKTATKLRDFLKNLKESSHL